MHIHADQGEQQQLLRAGSGDLYKLISRWGKTGKTEWFQRYFHPGQRRLWRIVPLEAIHSVPVGDQRYPLYGIRNSGGIGVKGVSEGR
ncbi:MAG: hypothetical protein EA427_11145 [Spirochaetaceae bacterium]|nr:MAG: hypothetical protein EA427_11145 [Spirochaetaceae bacterium]